MRETVFRGKFWAIKGEKVDVYGTVRTINAMESLKVRYAQISCSKQATIHLSFTEILRIDI